jgi:hypothetical protein
MTQVQPDHTEPVTFASGEFPAVDYRVEIHLRRQNTLLYGDGGSMQLIWR